MKTKLFGAAALSFWSSVWAPVALAAEPMRFAVIGDFGIAGKPGADAGDNANEKRVADLVKSWQPEFIITVGDNNYDFGDAETMDKNVGQFYGDYIGQTEAANRFFPTLGNHDWREGKDWNGPDKPGKGSPPADALERIKPHRDYFHLPGNERYYDFARGQVHFFAIDSDPHEPDGTKSDSVQALWLKQRLAAASEPWKVVYFHEPPYSGGPKHEPNTRMRWPFKEWGASLVLCGHEHNFQHFRVNGFDSLIDGLGGGGRYEKAVKKLDGYIFDYHDAYGALKAEADEQTLVLRFISTSGAEIYKLELKKP
jgi:hypothetical protein